MKFEDLIFGGIYFVKEFDSTSKYIIPIRQISSDEIVTIGFDIDNNLNRVQLCAQLQNKILDNDYLIFIIGLNSNKYFCNGYCGKISKNMYDSLYGASKVEVDYEC